MRLGSTAVAGAGMRVNGGRPCLHAGPAARTSRGTKTGATGPHPAPRCPAPSSSRPALSSLPQSGRAARAQPKTLVALSTPSATPQKLPFENGRSSDGRSSSPIASTQTIEKEGLGRRYLGPSLGGHPHPAPGPSAIRVRPWRCGEVGTAGHSSSQRLDKAGFLLPSVPWEASRRLSDLAHCI